MKRASEQTQEVLQEAIDILDTADGFTESARAVAATLIRHGRQGGKIDPDGVSVWLQARADELKDAAAGLRDLADCIKEDQEAAS